jgi:Bacterial Ig-like domain
VPASSLLTLVLPASSDSGVVGDNITRIAKPTLSGVAKPGATIIVQVDGVVLGTTVASGYGTWSFVPPENLASGTHTISASELDTDGSIIAAAILPPIIDEVAPPPTLMLAANSGSGVTGDEITIARQPTLSGNAEAGATVSIRIDGTVVGTTTATSTEAWSFTAPAALADGKYTVSATQLDVAGNNSLASTLALTIAASAATPTVTLAADSDSGVVGDNITNIAIPTLDGTAEPGETVGPIAFGLMRELTHIATLTDSERFFVVRAGLCDISARHGRSERRSRWQATSRCLASGLSAPGTPDVWTVPQSAQRERNANAPITIDNGAGGRVRA